MGHDTSINLTWRYRLLVLPLIQALLVYQSCNGVCLHAVVRGGKEIYYGFGEGHKEIDKVRPGLFG